MSSAPFISEEEHRQLRAHLGTGLPSQASQHLHARLHESQQTIHLTADLVTPKDTVYLKHCEQGTYHLDTHCTKIMIESCHDLTVLITQKVLTCTLELWKCERIVLQCHVPILTVQCDLSEKVLIRFQKASDFQSLVWSQCQGLAVQFDDSTSACSLPEILDSDSDAFESNLPVTTSSPTPHLITGLTQMRRLYTSLLDSDQFIVRVLKNHLRSERIVRLANGFPSTEREARAHDARQEAALRKLAEEVGLSIGKKGASQASSTKEVGRNDPCVCGSVKKYKKCCGMEVK